MNRKEVQKQREALIKERDRLASKLPKAKSATEAALMAWTPGDRKRYQN